MSSPLEASRLVIRPFSEQDLPAIRSLFIRVNRALAPPELRDAFEHYIKLSLRDEIDVLAEAYDAARGHGFWVASGPEGIVGMVGLQRVNAGTAEIRRIYIDPAFRRQGLGRALLRHAEQCAKQLGYDALVLSTAEIQTAAIELYKAEGFTQTSVEVADAQNLRTIGGGVRRFHFEKKL